jgi:TPR repeat protein
MNPIVIVTTAFAILTFSACNKPSSAQAVASDTKPPPPSEEANPKETKVESPDVAATYREAAERGDPKAQANLGKCYEYGKGVSKDVVEGVKWYREAAEKGDAQAQASLGNCYEHGNGVPKDATEGVKWYRKSADQGYAQGQYSLGYCYAIGGGVGKNQSEAVKWYRKAADQGFAVAQHNLGNSYAYGEGVDQNETEAANWYRKAADQNLAQSQCVLATRYALGIGVKKDEAEGFQLVRKSAMQGFVTGQSDLGLFYLNGVGTAKDNIEAYRWLSLASAQGDEHAKAVLTVLTEEKMSPAELAKAKELVESSSKQETHFGKTTSSVVKEGLIPEPFIGNWVEKSNEGKEIGTLVITEHLVQWDRPDEKRVSIDAKDVTIKEDNSLSCLPRMEYFSGLFGKVHEVTPTISISMGKASTLLLNVGSFKVSFGGAFESVLPTSHSFSRTTK